MTGSATAGLQFGTEDIRFTIHSPSVNRKARVHRKAGVDRKACELEELRSFELAMADYQARRDTQVLPMYEFTTELATLEPPPPELQ